LVDDRKVQAFTRSRSDWTTLYPAVVAAAEKLCWRSAVIDGEVIVQDEAGPSDFAAVQAMR
jgi:bifunctional non-homologous end joining protein LigD